MAEYQGFIQPGTQEEWNSIFYHPHTGVFHWRASGQVVSPWNQFNEGRVWYRARNWRGWQIAYLLRGLRIPDMVKFANGNTRDYRWSNMTPLYTDTRWARVTDNIYLGCDPIVVATNKHDFLPRYHVMFWDENNVMQINQPFYNLAYAMLFRDQCREKKINKIDILMS